MDQSLDRDTWQIVIQSVRRHARVVKEPGARRPRYPNWLIVAMYLWAVWHDRCLSWACHRVHYNTLFRPRKLPSISQFTRRIQSEACQAILQRVHNELARDGLACSLGFIDGKPLTVSPGARTPTPPAGTSPAASPRATSSTRTSTNTGGW